MPVSETSCLRELLYLPLSFLFYLILCFDCKNRLIGVLGFWGRLLRRRRAADQLHPERGRPRAERRPGRLLLLPGLRGGGERALRGLRPGHVVLDRRGEPVPGQLDVAAPLHAPRRLLLRRRLPVGRHAGQRRHGRHGVRALLGQRVLQGKPETHI